jgi:hypothetical protein
MQLQVFGLPCGQFVAMQAERSFTFFCASGVPIARQAALHDALPPQLF